MRFKIALAVGLWAVSLGALAQTNSGPVYWPSVGAPNGVAPTDSTSKVPIGNLPTATSGALGVVRGDGTTITNASGVLSAVGGTATPGGSSGQLQFNNSGSLGGATIGAGIQFSSGVLTNIGVVSFNTRTGAVTLSSGDVTTALGFTPAALAVSGLPVMNGTAALGNATTAAPLNHVHPTDTTRAPLDNPTFTGSITVPSWTTGTRPGSAVAGTYGYNTTLGRFDYYNGIAWYQYAYLSGDTFTGPVAATQFTGPLTGNVTGNVSGTAANVTGVVAVLNGGTGTTTPSIVAGTNVTVTGTWPNQTVNATAGGGGSGTVNSGTGGQLAYYGSTGTAVSGLTLGGGLAINSGVLNMSAPDVTSTTSYTIAAADMGGQRNLNGSGLTVTIPAISGTVLAQGMTVAISNQASSALTVSSTPTINGLANGGTLRTGGFMLLTSNGTSLDGMGFPGFGTITTNAVPKFLGADGGLGASAISDSGSQVVVSYLSSGATQCVQATSTGALQGSGSACGSGGGGGSSVPAIPQGRLTLTSGAPVMGADVSNTSTIYYTAHRGLQIPYYNGTADAAGTITGGQLSLTMATSGTGVTNSGGMFDIFYSGAAAAICVATNGSGGGWASDTGGSNTARGTGYSQVHNTRGYWTNQNAVANCYTGTTNNALSADQGTYLGSVYTTAAGQTSMQFLPAAAAGGSNSVLGLYNAYWRETFITTSRDTTSTWSTFGTTGVWRTLGGSSNNRVTWVDGLGQSPVRIEMGFLVSATNDYRMGQSCDSTTATPTFVGYAASNVYQLPGVTGMCTPAAGVHYAQGMEVLTSGTANVYPVGSGGQVMNRLQAAVGM